MRSPLRQQNDERFNPILSIKEKQANKQASMRSNRPCLYKRWERRAAPNSGEKDRNLRTSQAGVEEYLKDRWSRTFQARYRIEWEKRENYSGWISMRWSKTFNVESNPSSWIEESSWRRERLLTNTWGMFLEIWRAVQRKIYHSVDQAYGFASFVH